MDWEKVLVGVLAVVLLLWLGPGAKRRLENTRKATRKEWLDALVPIGLVVLFVAAVVMLA